MNQIKGIFMWRYYDANQSVNLVNDTEYCQ